MERFLIEHHISFGHRLANDAREDGTRPPPLERSKMLSLKRLAWLISVHASMAGWRVQSERPSNPSRCVLLRPSLSRWPAEVLASR